MEMGQLHKTISCNKRPLCSALEAGVAVGQERRQETERERRERQRKRLLLQASKKPLPLRDTLPGGRCAGPPEPGSTFRNGTWVTGSRAGPCKCTTWSFQLYVSPKANAACANEPMIPGKETTKAHDQSLLGSRLPRPLSAGKSRGPPLHSCCGEHEPRPAAVHSVLGVCRELGPGPLLRAHVPPVRGHV